MFFCFGRPRNLGKFQSKLGRGFWGGVAMFVLLSCARSTLCQADTVASTEFTQLSDASHGLAFLEAVDSYYQKNWFNGSILIAKNGEIVFEAGRGFADLENKVPVGPETKFQVASLTKPMTAAAIYKLQKLGKLSLDEPASRYFPENIARRLNFQGHEVTIRQLVEHSSGFGDYLQIPEFSERGIERKFTPAEILDGLTPSLRLKRKPGLSTIYSNTGYILLGHIIEKASEKRYGQFLANEIFSPLGMLHSGVTSETSTVEDLALPYRVLPGKNPKDLYTKASFGDSTYSCAWSAGGIFTTPRDYERFLKGVHSGALLGGELSARFIAANDTGISALGSLTRHPRMDDGKLYMHTGAMPGFSSRFIYLPRSGYDILVFQNHDDVGEGLISALLDVALEKPSFLAPVGTRFVASEEKLHDLEGVYKYRFLGMPVKAFRVEFLNEGYDKGLYLINDDVEKTKLVATSEGRFVVTGNTDTPQVLFDFDKSKFPISFARTTTKYGKFRFDRVGGLR